MEALLKDSVTHAGCSRHSQVADGVAHSTIQTAEI